MLSLVLAIAIWFLIKEHLRTDPQDQKPPRAVIVEEE